ncbi:uncharacterized protein LOC121726162 [Aricia agestis]|uniref:uncharacterized protein LOC121726162 n=1 Tax=Aricia agestis TaxID=91739 RepID=UPI001C208206|nr:uncharacterized protein LOC121726162 [Aricia agestis]
MILLQYLNLLFSIAKGDNQPTVDVVYFERAIEAVAYPYYMILLNMGTCKDRLLFNEEIVWGGSHLNRIIDIYYKSESKDAVVSSVVVRLIINDTDFLGFSELGVGFAEYSANIFLPVDTGPSYYDLNIFSCN